VYLRRSRNYIAKEQLTRSKGLYQTRMGCLPTKTQNEPSVSVVEAKFICYGCEKKYGGFNGSVSLHRKLLLQRLHQSHQR